MLAIIMTIWSDAVLRFYGCGSGVLNANLQAWRTRPGSLHREISTAGALALRHRAGHSCNWPPWAAAALQGEQDAPREHTQCWQPYQLPKAMCAGWVLRGTDHMGQEQCLVLCLPGQANMTPVLSQTKGLPLLIAGPTLTTAAATAWGWAKELQRGWEYRGRDGVVPLCCTVPLPSQRLSLQLCLGLLSSSAWWIFIFFPYPGFALAFLKAALQYKYSKVFPFLKINTSIFDIKRDCWQKRKKRKKKKGFSPWKWGLAVPVAQQSFILFPSSLQVKGTGESLSFQKQLLWSESFTLENGILNSFCSQAVFKRFWVWLQFVDFVKHEYPSCLPSAFLPWHRDFQRA